MMIGKASEPTTILNILKSRTSQATSWWYNNCDFGIIFDNHRPYKRSKRLPIGTKTEVSSIRSCFFSGSPAHETWSRITRVLLVMLSIKSTALSFGRRAKSCSNWTVPKSCAVCTKSLLANSVAFCRTGSCSTSSADVNMCLQKTSPSIHPNITGTSSSKRLKTRWATVSPFRPQTATLSATPTASEPLQKSEQPRGPEKPILSRVNYNYSYPRLLKDHL